MSFSWCVFDTWSKSGHTASNTYILPSDILSFVPNNTSRIPIWTIRSDDWEVAANGYWISLPHTVAQFFHTPESKRSSHIIKDWTFDLLNLLQLFKSFIKWESSSYLLCTTIEFVSIISCWYYWWYFKQLFSGQILRWRNIVHIITA